MERWLTFFSEFNFRAEYKPGKSNVFIEALSRRPDFEERHLEDISPAEARIGSSTLAFLRSDHVKSTLDSDLKEIYMQNEHCRLLIDHFGGRRVTLPSQLKAKLKRFSYSDGLL